MSERSEKSRAVERLQSLRNIGSVTAESLFFLGIKTPEQMKQADPEELYEELRIKSGGKLDRCVLYQFRGAILNVPWPMCKDLKGGDEWLK